MVDNVTADAGAGGAVFATDDIGAVHHPFVKLEFGPLDTATIVTATEGLPVTSENFKLASNSGVIIGDVNIVSNLPGSGALNLGKLEDAAHTTGDLGVMALSVRQNTAVSTSGTDGDYQPLITDTNGRLHTIDVGIDTALSGNELQVDIVAALPTGANAIGKLAANSGVDIGDVDVTSIIPGTGATNLGKAIDSPVGATDTGVLMLAVHDAEASKISVAEEDYDHLHIGELGGLSVEPEQHNHLDEMDATAGWAVLGNDTLNLATTTNHLTGTNALTFDKVDGAANTVIAGIDKTITSVNMGELDLHDIVQTVCFLSSIADVDYVFVRIGTDSTNYNEWRVPDTELVAGDFVILGLPVGAASQVGATGNGVRWDDIKYIAVGVAFDAQNNTLSGIIFDQLGIFTGSHTTAALTAEVSTAVNTANINLQKVGGSPTDKGAGNAGNGSQRIVIATDDINQAAIKTAVEIIDNIVSVEDAAHGDGDSGVMALGVRNDTLAALAGTDGDYAPLQVDANGALFVTNAPNTTHGHTPYLNQDTSAIDSVKGSAGTIYWISCMSIDATPVYLNLYDSTTATLGSTTPTNQFIVPTQGDANGAGFTINFGPHGIQYGIGIQVAAATTFNGSTDPGTNVVITNIGFE